MDDRIAWEEPSTSFVAVFILGMILSILVYFSPCAFPVLPGFISYYLSLGAREDELIKEGKLKNAMPSSWVIGTLAGLGMWTFFIIIGIIAFAMGEAFAQSGMIHIIAIGIALLLVVLGSIMLLGITSHVLGFVQKFVDRWSTTEMDDTFTPRRNMYLYGIGYAAASRTQLHYQPQFAHSAWCKDWGVVTTTSIVDAVVLGVLLCSHSCSRS